MISELEVKKRLLKVDKVIGETTVRKVIEATITLPIQAIKIFDVVAKINDLDTEVRNDGVLVAGNINKQLFVVDEGDIVRHIDEEVSFRQFIQIEGALPNMKAQVKARIIDVEAQLINDIEVRQQIVLELFVKVTEVKQIQVITDVIGGPKNLVVDKKLLKVESVIGEDEVSEVIKNTVQLPITAKKIFQIVPEVRNVQTEIKTDLVIIRGIVHKQIFLVDEGDLVRHVKEDVPFSITVPIHGARPNMNVQVNINVLIEQFQLIDPPSRKLKQFILLDIFVKVTETVQIKVVTDVRGTGIKTRKKLLKVDQVVDDVLQKETVESQIQLPIGAEKIFRIIAEITDVESEIVNGRVIIRGVLHKQIFFVDKSGLLRHVRENVPFQIIKRVPEARPDMNIQERLKIIGDIDFQLIDKKNLRQTAIIEVFIKITEVEQLEVVVDVIWKPPYSKPYSS
ncbi:MAG: DUF3794 domain-containing protein [Candidatus Syntrophonatronum acetioxidans]|uniref:DUF3794 domain-containing protein n=1 Tax=Candidatus Syntrophonatronum acetioxidans TaxID=1795816 RepID=A0A424YH06_9FIRM|nr:MAG: DUF3794 domain-containing protein [Candidatus Syntrophonatronum acetioxidans]